MSLFRWISRRGRQPLVEDLKFPIQHSILLNCNGTTAKLMLMVYPFSFDFLKSCFSIIVKVVDKVLTMTKLTGKEIWTNQMILLDRGLYDTVNADNTSSVSLQISFLKLGIICKLMLKFCYATVVQMIGPVPKLCWLWTAQRSTLSIIWYNFTYLF